jgi:hypothetical protein
VERVSFRTFSWQNQSREMAEPVPKLPLLQRAKNMGSKVANGLIVGGGLLVLGGWWNSKKEDERQCHASEELLSEKHSNYSQCMETLYDWNSKPHRDLHNLCKKLF